MSQQLAYIRSQNTKKKIIHSVVTVTSQPTTLMPNNQTSLSTTIVPRLLQISLRTGICYSIANKPISILNVANFRLWASVL